MARKLKSDRVLFLAALLLVGAGVVMVYSASAALAIGEAGQSSRFFTKQALWVTLGVASLFLIMAVDYRRFRDPRIVLALVGVAALGLIAVLFMPEINGARRWFRIGPLGGQPSEFAKIAIIVFTAAILERRMHRIGEPMYALGPIGILVALFTTLVLAEPDFGTALTLLLIVFAMVFAAGLPWRWLATLGLVLAPSIAGVLLMAGYRRRRVFAFLNPWEDPRGDGYQLIQSIIAVGTGGVTGKGLMEGVQKLFYLPYAETDFIYSVVSEELGLIGATLVLVAFLLIAWRGLRVAGRAPDAFGGLLAVGLTTMIAVQALVNISVVLGLLPTKGIPLPFVSAGGSSLLVEMVGLGILLSVSQQASAAN